MADYISMEAAKDKHCQICRDRAICYRGDGYSCPERKAFDLIPAADVRPVVKARWEDETGYIFNQLAQRVYCPVCKSYAYFLPVTTKNFCPNCGADMREVTP